jgi:AcrR family transcriptional regulator
MAAEDRYRSRRDEYAEATQQAVVTAARELFSEAGYSRTTVQQIARRARVSPANSTVAPPHPTRSEPPSPRAHHHK